MIVREKAIFLRDNHQKLHSFSDFDRIYIGDEFCEKHLPTISILENICKQYGEKNINLTLATPYLTNEGIKELSKILDFIVRHNLNLNEIVINDWGTLKLLKSYDGRFQIVLGRVIISHYLRFEHSKQFFERNLQNEKTINFYCLFPNQSLDFIKSQSISRLEFNSYYHLAITYEQLLEYGFKVNIYFPFVYLTTTRYCGCINGFGSYFRNGIESCNKE